MLLVQLAKQRKRGYEIAAVNISGGINTRRKKLFWGARRKNTGETVVKKIICSKMELNDNIEEIILCSYPK